MKIIIAPNALKDSLSAMDAAHAIQIGITRIAPEVETVCIPIADGGDGLLQVLKHALNGEYKKITVQGPLGSMVQASFLYCAEKKLAVVELASAAGLALLDEQDYDIRNASTYGVGQLIDAALELDINHLILGIGGSATNDAAMGIASALGVEFLDDNGSKLQPSANNLINISAINLTHGSRKIEAIDFDVICDVTNPLLGKEGAVAVFSQQKGADSECAAFLEKSLSHFADVIENKFRLDVRNIEGGGAAGGVGAGLKALFNANLCKGSELVLKLLSFDDQVRDADLLITAEGKLDSQTVYGKAPYVAAEVAKKYNVPVCVIAGQVETNDPDNFLMFDEVYTLTTKEISSQYAIEHAAELLQKTAEKLMKKSIADFKLS